MPTSKKTQDITASQITKENGKCSLPTILLNMSEQNNNSINALTGPKQGILQCLPEMFTAIDFDSHKHINGPYINGDLYKSYIFGKFNCNSAFDIDIKVKTHHFYGIQQ